MRMTVLAATMLLALAACHPGGSEKPRVEGATVRLSAVSGQPAAAYFRLHGGRSDDKLIRIDSAVANHIELHEAGMSGGMMTMRQITERLERTLEEAYRSSTLPEDREREEANRLLVETRLAG